MRALTGCVYKSDLVFGRRDCVYATFRLICRLTIHPDQTVIQCPIGSRFPVCLFCPTIKKKIKKKYIEKKEENREVVYDLMETDDPISRVLRRLTLAPSYKQMWVKYITLGRKAFFFLILSLCIYRWLMFRSFNPLARMMDELVVVIVAGTLWSVISPSLCLSCSIERNHNDGTIYRKEVRKKKKKDDR